VTGPLRRCAMAVVLAATAATGARADAQVPGAGGADSTASGVPATTGAVRISGRLVGADGRPIPVSHAHLQAWDDGRVLASARVRTDGTWILDAEPARPLALWLSGVGHRGERVGIVLEEGAGPLRVEARLGPHDLRPDPELVVAIGDFNGWKADDGTVPMKRDSTGRWSARLPTAADTLAFQALGLAWTERVAGTGAERYEYDGAGGYRSVARAEGGEARVAVDPARLPGGGLASFVQVTPGEGRAGRFAAFSRDLFGRVDAYFERRARAEASGATVADMRRIYEEYDPGPDAEMLAARLEEVDDPSLRAWMTAAYLAASLKSDPATARRALAEIPPDSPAWSIDPRALPEALGPSGRPEHARAYAGAVADTHPDPGVRAVALGHLLEDALRRDDPEALVPLYERLVEEHPDSRQAARARELYAPDRPIQPGRPVPEFAIGSMDDPSRTITRKSLLGRTYLMDFWATWCGPCITEMPWLHAAHERFGPERFTILSLSFDLDPEDVARFRAEGDWTMPWLHAYVAGGMDSGLAEDFGIVNIPRAILVGPDGRILATNEALRGVRLAETLAGALEAEGAR
jgi:thiol-disulfide isomerase/thioredoxin